MIEPNPKKENTMQVHKALDLIDEMNFEDEQLPDISVLIEAIDAFDSSQDGDYKSFASELEDYLYETVDDALLTEMPSGSDTPKAFLNWLSEVRH